MPRKLPEDDLLEDLPPIDDGEEEEISEDVVDPDLDLGAQESDRDLDDSVASELPVGELLDPIAEDSLSEPEEAEVDVGSAEVGAFEGHASTKDDDAAGLPQEDVAVGLDLVAENSSTGEDAEEQPGPSEDDVDESALPQLDSDDEADLPGGVWVDEGIELPEEVPLPRWAQVRWERLALPLIAVPMNAIAQQDERIVVAGQGAVELEHDNSGGLSLRWLPLNGVDLPDLVSIALTRDVWVASHSGVFLSHNSGVDLQLVGSAAEGHSDWIALCAFGTQEPSLCALTRSGELLLWQKGQWRAVSTPGPVRALHRDPCGELAALFQTAESGGVLRSTNGESWEELWAQGSVPAALKGKALLFGVRGKTAAVGTSEGSLAISGDRGSTWLQFTVPAVLTALELPPASCGVVTVGTVFVECEDKSYLFGVTPAGETLLFADLSPDVGVGASDEEVDESEGLGRATALHWDEQRGWLWVAGRFGLQAWRPVFPT